MNRRELFALAPAMLALVPLAGCGPEKISGRIIDRRTSGGDRYRSNGQWKRRPMKYYLVIDTDEGKATHCAVSKSRYDTARYGRRVSNLVCSK